MKIKYWSDYACPYCYIGETLLRQALDELDVFYEFEMKAFELNPYAKKGAGGDVVAMFAAKYQLNLDEAQTKVDSINEMAKIAERLYKAYFAEHVDVADHEVLVGIAKEMGLDEAEVRAMLSGKDFSDEVSRDEREAQLSRITSVPCFVINEKVAVPGAMPKDQFKDLIKKYFPGEVSTAI